MFSYLILCSNMGPSLMCLACLHVPPVPCSTAYLVQLMTPGVACHSSFHIYQFQFISLNATASETCPVSFLLTSFKIFVFVFLFLWKTQKKILQLSLFGLELEENLIFCI
uniref:Uncharacterized protein n=1 Tax=Prolemur simus TaxID=1328070 RepID=A0A8C9DJW0_PROSS